MAAYFNALLVCKRLFKRTLKEVKMIPRDGWVQPGVLMKLLK